MERAMRKRTCRDIENWLAARIAVVLNIDEAEISFTEPFSDLGLGSIQAVGITGELEDYVNLPLSPDLLWNYPNIRSLAKFIEEELQIQYDK